MIGFYISWRHSYFQNESTLNEELQKEGITDLFLCGLATDVCVGDIWIKIENISSKILSFSGKLYFIVFRQELINSNNIQVGAPSTPWSPDTGR